MKQPKIYQFAPALSSGTKNVGSFRAREIYPAGDTINSGLISLVSVAGILVSFHQTPPVTGEISRA